MGPMAIESPKIPPVPPRTRWQKLARRGMLALAGALILLIAIFFLIPVWMSNEQGRIYVLDRINRTLAGPRVSIDNWSLGWFHSTHIKNLRITQPDGTVLLSCPNVSSGLTLWELFRGDYDAGNTLANNLELTIIKYSDGSTSLDSFARQAAGVLGSLRGALQITGGKLKIESEKTGQSLSISNIKSTITIASPDAPFHVKVFTVSPEAGALSLDASWAPTRTLISGGGQGGWWPLMSDLDFSASAVPTKLLCDFLGLDPEWADSFGNSLNSFQISAHPVNNTNTAGVSFMVNSGPAAGLAPYVDAHMLLQPGSDAAPGLLLTIPNADFHARAALRFSRPLSREHGHLNPIFSESAAPRGTPDGLLNLQITALSLPLSPGSISRATAGARFSFPPLLFTARDGPSIVRQLELIRGDLQRNPDGSPAPAPGSCGPLRVTLADGAFNYDNFVVTLRTTDITFSGSVGISGNLDLLADMPGPSAGLSAGHSQELITGTVDSPLVNHAD